MRDELLNRRRVILLTQKAAADRGKITPRTRAPSTTPASNPIPTVDELMGDIREIFDEENDHGLACIVKKSNKRSQRRSKKDENNLDSLSDDSSNISEDDLILSKSKRKSERRRS